MIPSSATELAVIGKMADTAVASGSQNESWDFFQFVKGVAEYRQGNYASGVEWMQKTLASEGKVHFRDSSAYSVLALAHHQLKQFDQARAALAKGGKIEETDLPPIGRHNLGVGWKDCIIARVLLREAGSLVEDGSKTSDEPK